MNLSNLFKKYIKINSTTIGIKIKKFLCLKCLWWVMIQHIWRWKKLPVKEVYLTSKIFLFLNLNLFYLKERLNLLEIGLRWSSHKSQQQLKIDYPKSQNITNMNKIQKNIPFVTSKLETNTKQDDHRPHPSNWVLTYLCMFSHSFLELESVWHCILEPAQ